MSEDAFPLSQNRSQQAHEDKPKQTAVDPFEILSDTEGETIKEKWKKKVLSDSDGDTDVAEDDEEDETESKFAGFRQKKTKGIRKEFVDEEASLSGSEYDSDENLDLAEEDDILEQEEGDKDLVGVSEEALRDQVGRAHMKQVQDEDDREVLRFKEMYLQDGDLYSDGKGRMRNFRWKDMDGDDAHMDRPGDDSDTDLPEEDNDEAQWRKDRLEREKFLEESQQQDDSENLDLEESQLLKMGSFIKKKDKLPSVSAEAAVSLSKPAIDSAAAPLKPRLPKKGSFLSRSKDALVKMAQVAKGALGGGAGGKAKNFIFQTADKPDENSEVATGKEQVQPMQPPKRKANEAAGGNTPLAKKQKVGSSVDPKPKRSNSIFNLLQP